MEKESNMTGKSLIISALLLLSCAGSCASINSDSISQSTLSQTKKNALLFMIEEEKLTKDVYEYLHDTWGLKIFASQAKVSKVNMDKILVLFDKHNLETPATLRMQGAFENIELQNYYDNLTQKADFSLHEALKVTKKLQKLSTKSMKSVSQTRVTLK